MGKMTNAELEARVKELEEENSALRNNIASLEDQVANPNRERIAELTVQVNGIEAEITAEKAGNNDTKAIAALQSKKSKLNGYLKVLGGEPLISKRQAPPANTLGPDELQSRINDLCWERHNILASEKETGETLEGYKRRAVIASDLSKYRKALRKLGLEPNDPVADAKEARKAEVAAAVEAGDNGTAEALAAADLQDNSTNLAEGVDAEGDLGMDEGEFEGEEYEPMPA